MDNSAFSKLVRDRSSIKSTKEIARDAVQAEFQKKNKGQKRQRRGGHSNQGYSSDEDDSGRDNKKKYQRDGGDKNEDEILKPQFRISADGQVVKTEKGDKKDAGTIRYRDRAKERREGDGEEVPPSKDAIYDELLEEEMDAAEEQIFHSRRTKRHEQEEESLQCCENQQQGREFVEQQSTQPQGMQASSSLGREMLEYLRDAYLETADSSGTSPTKTSVSGQTLQGTVLTFSTEANPGDYWRSWELPKEQTFGSQAGEARELDKLSSCSPDLLQKMQRALARQRDTTKQKQNTKQSKSSLNGDDDESDDDIFGTVGSYDPLQSRALKATGASKSDDPLQKKSFFGDNSEEEGEVDQGNAVAAQTAQTLRGFAASSVKDYAYGEEMDVDFDGRFEGDDDKKKKKKKRDDDDD